MLVKGLITALAAVSLVPSSVSLAPPSNPGAWHPVGKVVTSRIGNNMHIARTAVGMKALAFVVASRSPRPLHVIWTSYCEFNSDDEYTESYSGKLTGVGRIEYYPHVFNGATLCDVVVTVAPIKGARTVAAVYAY